MALIYVICWRAPVLFTLFVGGLLSYLRYFCLFTYSGVQYLIRANNFICQILLKPKLCHNLCDYNNNKH
jgi:hypothetical protein